ncbi:unnamed protein product [Urochloa humidicola]
MRKGSLLAAFVFVLSTMAPLVEAAIVEHTFLVSTEKMKHLCKETLVTVVNGQLPGPVINVTRGDSVAVHVVNKSPSNVTIHWHGVRQWLNCWADGVPMITQRPILPNHNFTYRFNVSGQEGTLWWHAHVSCLRATVHGALIIRPRHESYPFPMPHMEIPIIIGDWWQKDLQRVAWNMAHDSFGDFPSGSTINGKLGDLFNCSGAPEDGYLMQVEPGKTYLLRVINAGMFSEFYLKIAGHKFTVVAADANYVSPYTTDVIAIAPGETVDALVVADAPPGRYYMVAIPTQPPLPDPQVEAHATRAILQYSNTHSPGTGSDAAAPLTLSLGHNATAGGGGGDQSHRDDDDDVPVAPHMPDQHDALISFYFHGNLTSLPHVRPSPIPLRADEHMLITLGLGTVCRRGQSCKTGIHGKGILVASMNNVSFEPPEATTTPLLEAHYYHTGDIDAMPEFPDRPPRVFNFTDRGLTPWGSKEMQVERASKATAVRRFRHGAVVEMVFQNTAVLQSDSNPMHLHGHDMMVLAQGHGNYNATKDVASYNLVNPPFKNTVVVPNLGWVAVRFVANNPGVWFVHCHFEFHLTMGMATVFIVDNGPTIDTSLPPPPEKFPIFGPEDNIIPDE